MSENSFKNWYKDSFSESNVYPPKSDNWEKIDAKVNNWLNHWYQSNAEQVNIKPKSNNWDIINEKLNYLSETKKSRRLHWQRGVAASLFVFLMPFFVLDDQLNVSTIKDNVQSSNNPIKNKKVNAVIANSLNSPVDLITNNNSKKKKYNSSFTEPNNTDPLNRSSINSMESSKQEHQTLSSSTKTQHNTGISSFNDNELINVLPLLSINSIPQNELSNTNIERTNPATEVLNNPKWTFGIALGLQGSNLYNPTLFRGLENKKSIHNLFNGSITLNSTVARKVTKNSWITAGLIFNDKKEQSYIDNTYPEHIEKELLMTFQSISLGYRQMLFANRLNGKFGLESSISVIGSYRTNIQELWDNQSRNDLSKGYKSYDLGISIGLVSKYSINTYLDLITEIYYSNGIINLFHGTDEIPANFYKTYTSAYGLNIGMRYNLK